METDTNMRHRPLPLFYVIIKSQANKWKWEKEEHRLENGIRAKWKLGHVPPVKDHEKRGNLSIRRILIRLDYYIQSTNEIPGKFIKYR